MLARPTVQKLLQPAAVEARKAWLASRKPPPPPHGTCTGQAYVALRGSAHFATGARLAHVRSIVLRPRHAGWLGPPRGRVCVCQSC